MSDPFDDDDFFEGLDELDQDTLAELAQGLRPLAPARAWDAVSAELGCRFQDHAQQVAAALDINEAQALTLLTQVDAPESWSPGLMPGMSLFHVEGGPKVERAVTGFVRLDAGMVFPEHRHLGDELVLILQGYFTDSVTGVEHGPGDLIPMSAGSAHGFEVLEGGTGLMYLVVIQEGVDIGGNVLMYDDPNL